jgi:hypothetical protein
MSDPYLIKQVLFILVLFPRFSRFSLGITPQFAKTGIRHFLRGANGIFKHLLACGSSAIRYPSNRQIL